MALVDEVTARYANAKLVRLTNPEDTNASTVDTTRLGLAATDATAEFLRRTATTLDIADAQHVDVAVELVILKLMERGGATAEATRDHRERLESQFDSLAKVTGRDRPMATTSGQDLTLTPEVSGGAQVRPKFDARNLDGYMPRRPGG